MVVEKRCFIICPIGEDGSEIRRRSDVIFDYVIKPAVSEFGYTAIRADRLDKPGIITSQIIQHLVEDELVVADLTGRNPNVYYELAVRHAVRKPVIQIIQASEQPPFDVGATRIIPLDHKDLPSAAKCMESIKGQIEAIEADPSQQDNPISVGMDIQFLRQSEDPSGNIYQQILSSLGVIPDMVGRELEKFWAELKEFEARSERSALEGELLAAACHGITTILRELSLHYKKLEPRPQSWDNSHKGWPYEQKWEVLRIVNETFKRDNRQSGGAGDYFKATLFKVKSKDLLELDCNHYPPAVVPKTKAVLREMSPKSTAFHCLDLGAMEIISDVPEEAKRGETSRWVELWPGQANLYGSMICVPITIGERSENTFQVISILTIDTNRRGYFQEKDRNFIATLLAPFRHALSLIYLLTERGL